MENYLTNLKGLPATLGGYNASLFETTTGIKNVSKLMRAFNKLPASEHQNFSASISATNKNLGSYLSGLKGADASLGGYMGSLALASIKTIGLKVATIGLNTALSMGVSLLISAAITAISAWINRSENLAKKAEEASEKIKSLNDTFKTNQKTITDSSKRFAELAQGVDILTGKNITLTPQDYEEFLSLSNEIAEIFPALSRVYDDNGNAIVQLSGDVDTIVGSLQNLIEAERELTNSEISDGLSTIFDNVKSKSSQNSKTLKELKAEKKSLQNALKIIESPYFSSDFAKATFEGFIQVYNEDPIILDDYEKAYEDFLQELNIPFQKTPYESTIDDNAIKVPCGLTLKISPSDVDIQQAEKSISENVEKLKEKYSKEITSLDNQISIINQQEAANWSNLTNSISSWLSTDPSYKFMNNTMQAAVQQMISNLSWSSMEEIDSWKKAQDYIQKNILSIFQGANRIEVSAAFDSAFDFKSQFQNGEITLSQYYEKLQALKDLIKGFDPETKKSIELIFTVTSPEGKTTDEMAEDIQKMLAKDEDKEKVKHLTYEQLEIASSLNIDDAALTSWTELLNRISEEKKKLDAERKKPVNILNANKDSIDNFQSSISALSDAYDKIRNGASSSDMVDLFQEFPQLANKTDHLDEAIKTLAEEELYNLLALCSDMPDDFKHWLIDIKNKAFDTNEVLLPLSDAFSSLKSNASLLNKANAEITEGFSVETLQSMVSAYGDSIDEAAAKYSTGLMTGEDLFKVLEECYKKDINNYNKSIHQKLFNDSEYYSSIISNENSRIIELANAYGIDYSNWTTLQKAKLQSEASLVEKLNRLWGNYYNIFFDDNGYASVEFTGPTNFQGGDLSPGYEIIEQHNALMAEFNRPLDLNYDGILTDWKSIANETENAGKSAANYTSTLDDALKKLDAKMDAAAIDFSVYLNSRLALIQKYYDQGKITADQYYDYLGSCYEKQLSYMDKVVSAVTRRFDQEIDSINETIDSIEKQNEALEKQKEDYEKTITAVSDYYQLLIDNKQASIDGLEEQNDGLEDLISKYDTVLNVVQEVFTAEQDAMRAEQDAIQEKIDALQKANEEKEKQLSLEKSQYALEQAQRMKTRKVYDKETGQYVYKQDYSAIREAKESLDALETQAAIDAYQKEIDSIQTGIDGLEEKRKAWEESSKAYDKAQDEQAAKEIFGDNYKEYILNSSPGDIAKFQQDYTSAKSQVDANKAKIDAYNQEIKSYQDSQKQWNDMTADIEKNINQQIANMILGSDWQKEINEGRFIDFDEFKLKYLEIDAQLNSNQALIDSYTEKAEYYQHLKDQWGALSQSYENSTNDQIAKMFLGENWESDVLNGRLETLSDFQTTYTKIQSNLAQIAWNTANEQIRAAKEAEKGGYGKTKIFEFQLTYFFSALAFRNTINSF